LRPYFLSAATIGRLARRGNEIKEGIGEPLLQKKEQGGGVRAPCVVEG
jgi:hypothetical protein